MPRIGDQPTLQGATHGIARDWKTHPAVVELKAPKNLYCVGDVHGDYDSLVSLLSRSGLVDRASGDPSKVRWTGGKAALVCTGDLIDKWGQSLDVIALLRSLQAQAGAAGGRVVVTLGNHEQELLASPGDEKCAEFVGELRAAGLDPQKVVDGKDPAGIGSWLRNLPVAAKVDDWFFVHAGNAGNRTVGEIEHDVEQAIAHDGFDARILDGENSMLKARLPEKGWWKGTTGGLEGVLGRLGVKHVVMGHEPGKVKRKDGSERKAGEMARTGGKDADRLFLVDAGLSRAVDGDGALLHVRFKHGDERATSIDPSGHERNVDAFEDRGKGGTR